MKFYKGYKFYITFRINKYQSLPLMTSNNRVFNKTQFTHSKNDSYTYRAQICYFEKSHLIGYVASELINWNNRL